MQEALKSAGFRAALAQNSGVICSGSDLYALPRFPVAGVYGRIDRFKEKARMKALRITEARPDDHVLQKPDNPTLFLTIDKKLPVNLKEIQCFIAGAVSAVYIEKPDTSRIIRVKASRPFRSRRTLYTLTAPSRDHKQWYWYSYPWFCPVCE